LAPTRAEAEAYLAEAMEEEAMGAEAQPLVTVESLIAHWQEILRIVGGE
jgi:hypothetical protein